MQRYFFLLFLALPVFAANHHYACQFGSGSEATGIFIDGNDISNMVSILFPEDWTPAEGKVPAGTHPGTFKKMGSGLSSYIKVALPSLPHQAALSLTVRTDQKYFGTEAYLLFPGVSENAGTVYGDVFCKKLKTSGRRHG